ncbi:MAG: methyltransferase domain-containing protein [Candidatus Cybelea sp.]
MDDIRARQREEWSAAAKGWAAGGEDFSEISLVTQQLIELANITAGNAVLDVACGSGDPAFAIAKVVGPRGRVVGLDITPDMIGGATALARHFSITNVEFRTINNELATNTASDLFDAVTCRFGLMYMPDPRAATRAWRGALRSGGRIAVSTWASLPLIGFVLDLVARHAPVPVLNPEGPGIFALSTPAILADVLQAAGYTNIDVRTLNVPSFAELPPEEWWDMMACTAGPLVTVLNALPPETYAKVRQDGIRALRERHPSGIVMERGDALLAAGTNEPAPSS